MTCPHCGHERTADDILWRPAYRTCARLRCKRARKLAAKRRQRDIIRAERIAQGLPVLPDTQRARMSAAALARHKRERRAKGLLD